jgi:hypothetical protein
VVVPGLVVVVVPGALVALAGILVFPPAGTGAVPPAGESSELEAPRFTVPEPLPAVEPGVAPTPLLRLIPGLPTALGPFVVFAPLLSVELPMLLVLFVPATVPVGTVVR